MSLITARGILTLLRKPASRILALPFTERGSTSKLSLTRSAELAKTFDRAKTLLGTAISDFEYDPRTQESAAFIAAPILKEGNFVGVVALQMSTREVYEVVNDYTGLGETGETFLATRKGTEVVFTTPPRHDPQGAM